MPKRTFIKLEGPKRDPYSEGKKRKIKNYLLSPVTGAVLGRIFLKSIFGVYGVVIGGGVGLVSGIINEKERGMTKIPAFYSFHFDKDVMRVQQVRNIGTVEGNSPTTPNEWETLKRSGKRAVENWIDQNMKYKRCCIVLIGTDTASRPWVKYEIEKAWNDGKALLGIYIHNLKCPRAGASRKGQNPFDGFKFNDGRALSSVVPCYDPSSLSAYRDISNNMAGWISSAISNKAN